MHIFLKLQNNAAKENVLAMEAERATDDLKKVEYMQDKIGDKFDGIISGVMANGIFVELENTVEGLVHISKMDDDYYIYIEKHHCLMGKRTRNVYRLGDKVTIKVNAVDIVNRRVDFILHKTDKKKKRKKADSYAKRRKNNSSKQKSKT